MFVRCSLVLSLVVLASSVRAAEPVKPPAGKLGGAAQAEADMGAYVEKISGTTVQFEMLPIPGGTFVMGSPASEKDRSEDEGPQHRVKLDPFWMGKCEVTWEEYDIWSFNLDIKRRAVAKVEPTPLDKHADAVTRPTKPYTDMTFGMGHDGYPAICMTQHAAKTYCEWLSAKTGHYYRLPTEAEWEYACRAGTTTAYSFGDDASQLDDYAWFADNSDDGYHQVGKKKPNPWGLHDMHGNVMEWCLDQHVKDAYTQIAKTDPAVNPLILPTKLYPQIARGGSWEHDPDGLRSAARVGSEPLWKVQDPQIPKSIWFLTDAQFLGFRVVRPLKPATEEEREKIKKAPPTLDEN